MSQRVYELLNQAHELDYGQARTLLVEEALRHAEADSDPKLAFRVRLELRTEYVQGGERAKAFAVFVRTLADYDKDPGAFDFTERHHLLWGFKGTVMALPEFPEIPLDRTLAVLDDMEHRYNLAGQGLQPVYMCRTAVTRHVCGAEAAAEWYARWHAAPRSALSDCEGCDPSGKVRQLAALGRDEDAVALAEPVLVGWLNCAEQPQTMLTELLPVYLRTGRTAAAADAHRRAYRIQRSRLSELWAIAVHLEFCALSGNEARGLEILERHLGWLPKAPTPHDAMSFAAAGALLLRRLSELGHNELTIRRDGEEVAGPVLREELTAYALDLAARFDARNGTAEQSRLARETLAAEPLVDHLPLTPLAHAQARSRFRPVPAPPAAEDLDELLDTAEAHWMSREAAQAVAALQRFDEVVGRTGVQPSLRQRARRTDGAGNERYFVDDPQGAAERWQEAAALFAEAGDQESAKAATGRYASAICRLGRADEGVPLLRESFAWLTANATDRRRPHFALLRLVTALADTGRRDEALALLHEASAEPGTPDWADLEATRGQVLLRTPDRLAEAADALRNACTGYRDSGQAGALANAALLLAQLLPPEDETAGALVTEALANAPAEQFMMRAAAHAIRGGLLLARGELDRAADDLVEAVAGFTVAGAYDRAAYARQDLCVAYLNTGRHLEAAEAAEEAIAVFDQLGDVPAGRRTRYLLANAQRELGELEAAAGSFTTLADAERASAPGVAGEFYGKAGELLSKLDKDGLAAERFGAAADAAADAADPYGAVRYRRQQAMCLLWTGSAEQGLSTMALARGALSALPADNQPGITWETALIDYDEARILAALGRAADAVAAVDRAITAFRSLDEADAADAAEGLRADLLGQTA
jgi:tetratricopeptide (TPR) repeat protein